MACPNIGTIEINIKMALNAVMERDSQNPTPILDKEPILEMIKGVMPPYKTASLPYFLSYKLLYPIKLSSTAIATSLPSLIAHTTRLCPLCISPVTNIFS